MSTARLRSIKIARALAVFRARPARPPRAVEPLVVCLVMLPGSALLALDGKKVEFDDVPETLHGAPLPGERP